MNAKRLLAGMIAGWIALGSARAQSPTLPPTAPPVSSEPAIAAPPIVSAPDTLAEGYDVPGVTRWIRRDAKCCTSLGCGNPSIGEELYFRAGPSFPLGDGPRLGRNLAVGFTVQGGARTLFYDSEYTRAWVVDASVSNTFNNAVSQPTPFLIDRGVLVAPQPATVSEANRTFVNLGVGREWFLYPALNSPSHLRLGVDGGGRWGSMIVRNAETRHAGDVIGGMYVGSHILYEYACWHSIFNAGLRTEYSYTWSDAFRQQSDISELNLLINVGVRY